MEFENLMRLIRTVSDSGLTGLKYEDESVKLTLSKKPGTMQAAPELTAVNDAVKTVREQQGTAAAEETGYLVSSPLVGVFYAAPAEDAAPFVAVGDTVKKGQTLAIVEAMKLMNDIECEVDGTIAEILVRNGQPVEYGQPLFCIRCV